MLQPWFRENLGSLMKDNPVHQAYYSSSNSADESETLLKVMKVKPASRWTTDDSLAAESHEESFIVNLQTNGNRVVTVKGYDLLVELHISVTDIPNADFLIDKDAFRCRLDSADNRLTLMPGKDSVLEVDLSPVVTVAGFEQTLASYTLPVEIMTLDAGNSRWAGRLVVRRFDGILRNGKKHITSLNGYLLVKKK